MRRLVILDCQSRRLNLRIETWIFHSIHAYEMEILFDFNQSDVKISSDTIKITRPEGVTNFSIVPISFIDGKSGQVMIAAYRVQTSGTSGTSGSSSELRSMILKFENSTELNLLTSAHLSLHNEVSTNVTRRNKRKKATTLAPNVFESLADSKKTVQKKLRLKSVKM